MFVHRNGFLNSVRVEGIAEDSLNMLGEEFIHSQILLLKDYLLVTVVKI